MKKRTLRQVTALKEYVHKQDFNKRRQNEVCAFFVIFLETCCEGDLNVWGITSFLRI